MVWGCLTSANTGEFFWIKIIGTEQRTGKILVKNLLQSALYQTLGEEFTCQQDNNLQHMAKSTLELLIKKTVKIYGKT